MNTKPKQPSRVSAAEFGALVNRSREHVTRLSREGVLPPLVAGKFELVAALLSWCASLESRLAAKTGADERIKNARAEKLELANSATKRDTIPAEEVRRDITRGFTALRGQLLAIPKNLAQTLALVTDATEVEERIEREIISVLTTMSTGCWSENQDSEK